MFSPQSQHEFMISYKDDTSYFEVPPEWVAPITNHAQQLMVSAIQ